MGVLTKFDLLESGSEEDTADMTLFHNRDPTLLSFGWHKSTIMSGETDPYFSKIELHPSEDP